MKSMDGRWTYDVFLVPLQEGNNATTRPMAKSPYPSDVLTRTERAILKAEHRLD
jgi:hypothetical protein